MNQFWRIWPLPILLAVFALVFFHNKEEKKPVRVYVNLVGDLFHSGHVELFRNAKSLGDYLVVGLMSDQISSAYQRVPVLTLEERVRVISACKYVDEVIPNAPLGVTEEFLDAHKIDLVAHGDDFDEAQARIQYGPAIDRNILRFVMYTEGISSSEIITRITERYRKNPQGLQKRDFLEGTKAALHVQNSQ